MRLAITPTGRSDRRIAVRGPGVGVRQLILARFFRDNYFRDGHLRRDDLGQRSARSPRAGRLKCGLEFNQSAHHCRPMMMCWWRSGWVWVRLGLTSSSKR